MNESCVETPDAPEWLLKLENRREKLKLSKLGHESGAGAPCNACGTKCPGLDLHFWRKVCRSCKCRKDQHECVDDDLTGWAQFEILGQMRSKPAYVKISRLAEKPVKLDWVPPNIGLDLASDYLTQLGPHQIPITGSEAAAKRKQQLEYQVPPHDLEPALCDNLSEKETNQLKQYIEKIKENCVGQGNVVRINETSTNENISNKDLLNYLNDVIDKNDKSIVGSIVNDKVISRVLHSDIVRGLLGFSKALSKSENQYNDAMVPDFAYNNNISDKNKYKLKQMNINSQALQSAVINGVVYDKILTDLKKQNIDFSNDQILKPIDEFRKEFSQNPKFRNDIENCINTKPPIYLPIADDLNRNEAQFCTPIKKLAVQDSFNSPSILRPSNLVKQGILIQQETPMRKVKFDQSSFFTKSYDEMKYKIPSIEKDNIISQILQSEMVKGIFHNPSTVIYGRKLVLNNAPMIPDFENNAEINNSTKKKLNRLNINKNAVESGVVHGDIYDNLFDNFIQKEVDFNDDTILKPIHDFREEYLNNNDFRSNINNLVDNMSNISDKQPELLENRLLNSKSNDSGFVSIPPTPNYATYPNDFPPGSENQANYNLSGISDIEVPPNELESNINSPDMQYNQLSDKMDQMFIKPQNPNVFIKCNECKKEILSGEVAVKADRAGKEASWHPQCFVCNACHELLADLVYFYHGGHVYCARDLAVLLKIPRCNACDELIFTKEYTAAENSTFHIKHFCCFNCDLPLAGQQYIPDDKTNMPLCLKCYDVFAEKCNICNKVIGPSEQGVAWDKIHWHGSCFKCFGINCGKSLIGCRFCVKNEMPFCSPQCLKSVIK